MKDKAFAELIQSVREVGKIRRGLAKPARVTTFKCDDVRKVRRKLGQTQIEFAALIGVSVATLRNWEQGRRRPDGPALVLLRVTAQNPRAVIEAVHGMRPRGAA